MHLAFFGHFPLCARKPGPRNSDHPRSKRWEQDVSRARALKQERDLGEEVLAWFDANTTSREGLGQVVVQAAEILLGSHVDVVCPRVARSTAKKITHAAWATTACRCEVVHGHVVKIHAGHMRAQPLELLTCTNDPYSHHVEELLFWPSGYPSVCVWVVVAVEFEP